MPTLNESWEIDCVAWRGGGRGEEVNEEGDTVLCHHTCLSFYQTSVFDVKHKQDRHY